MKIKILLASACMLLASTTYVDAKKPEKNYLPEAGDVTIGVNAVPFLNYLGNMFGKQKNNKINPAEIGGVPAVPGLDNPTMSIFGKYFLTDQTALRLNVGIGINSITQSQYVTDDAAAVNDPLSQEVVEDTYKYRNSGMSVAVGYEWRRGSKRLQGYWGGQAILAYSNSKHFFGYGNAITEVNQIPTAFAYDKNTNKYNYSVWGVPENLPDINGNGNIDDGDLPIDNKNVGNNSRLLMQSDGRSWTYGVGGFVGVEYYIAPKISIGCEMSLNLLWTTGSKKYQKSERFNPDFNRVEENTRWTGKSDSGFRFGTENIGTSLFVAFSF